MNLSNLWAKSGHRLLLGAAIIFLLLSGAAGLIYQVVWTRYLALFTGSTSHAVVAILVAFMGGLALGNYVLGKVADRALRPLALYGWLEVAIGLYALIFPVVFETAYGIYLTLAEGSEPGGTMLLVGKFLLALLSVLVPTFLMGGTLPVLTKMVTRSLGELQQRLSALYFINSAGAIGGVALAEFLLIPAVGLEYTVTAGAIVNLLVGVPAVLIGYLMPAGKASLGQGEEPPPEEIAEETEISPLDARLAVWAIGVSGFVAMLYEVAWTRLLALAIGSSSNAFAIMLITFITGLTIGAWLIGRYPVRRRHMWWLAWLEIGVGVSVAVTMCFYESFSYWFLVMTSWVARSEANYPIYQMVRFTTCFAVMIVPTIILGTTLPLVSRIATAELAKTGRSVGAVFSINTVGTVLGAGATGLFLMPVLGLARTFALGTGLNVAIGLLILARGGRARFRWRILQVVGLTVAWVLAAGVLFHDSWVDNLDIGHWRSATPPASFREFQLRGAANPAVYHRDGSGATVVVTRTGEKGGFALQVNGKTDASTGVDMATQQLLGHLPMLLHPAPENTMVVGLGSGVTAGSILQHGGVAYVDTVEIQKEVVAAARFFDHVNNQVLDNPRHRLHVDDAKSFLHSRTNKYDVIISEPSNPWMAGVAGLFSREFYSMCSRRLADDGLMVQWFQIYESSDQAFDTIMATFSSVFPYLQIWRGSVGDLILVGAERPFEADVDRFVRRMAEPGVAADLQRIRINRPVVLLSHQIRGQQSTRYVVGPTTRIHSDFFPVLDHYAQLAFFALRSTEKWKRFDERDFRTGNLMLADHLAAAPLAVADIRALLEYQPIYGFLQPNQTRSLLEQWQGLAPDSLEPALKIAEERSLDDAAGVAGARLASRFGAGKGNLDPDTSVEPIAAGLMMQGYRSHRSVFYAPDPGPIERALKQFIGNDPGNRRLYHCFLLELALDAQNEAMIAALRAKVIDPDESTGGSFAALVRDPSIGLVLYQLLDRQLNAGDIRQALGLVKLARDREFLPAAHDLVTLMIQRLGHTLSEPAGPYNQFVPGASN
jgi:spermidine synthase